MRARVRQGIRGHVVSTVGLACAGLVAAGLALSAPVSATPAAPYVGPGAKPATDSFVYIDEPVSEVPNAVAVANDGTIAASLFNPQSIALVRGPGDVVDISLGCSPADVAIHPDATLAWAVCPGDPHLHVIDVASGQVAVGSLELKEPDDIVYLPAPNRLVVADFDEGIVVTTGAPNYEVIKRIPTPDNRPTALAVLDDGSRGYAVTDSGRLLAIDMERGTVRELTGQGPDVSLVGLGLSQSGTVLYAAGNRQAGGNWLPCLMRLDPVTGRVLQEVTLDFVLPGTTSMALTAGYRSLSVATGLGVEIDGKSTGAFAVDLSGQGVMGELSTLLPVSYLASDVGSSADGLTVAFGITDSRVAGVLTPGDQPYPPSVTVQGRLAKSVVTLNGTTTALQPGTPLTVLIQDATKKKAAFVAQPIKAVVDARGAYTWKGKAPSKRVRILVTGPECASPTISLIAK